MKNTKIIKITAFCICIILLLLALRGCPNTTSTSSKLDSKVQATAKPIASAKPTDTPTASAKPSASSEPEATADATDETATASEDTSAYVATSSNDDSSSNNYYVPSASQSNTSNSSASASRPVSTPVPATPAPTPEPTPVATPNTGNVYIPPVHTTVPEGGTCASGVYDINGYCHVGTCMSLDEVVSKGEAWEIEHNYMGGVTFGDEDWDGCYVYYTNDGQYVVGDD